MSGYPITPRSISIKYSKSGNYTIIAKIFGEKPFDLQTGFASPIGNATDSSDGSYTNTNSSVISGNLLINLTSKNSNKFWLHIELNDLFNTTANTIIEGATFNF